MLLYFIFLFWQFVTIYYFQNATNNRIKFEDDDGNNCDKQQSPKLQNKKNDLFSDDDNDNNETNLLWNEDEFSSNKDKHKKVNNILFMF